jgi:hypothetical protein
VSALLVLFVAELFVIAAMWHNKSSRSEREHESGRPDPAVLFSRIRPQHIANGTSLPVNATRSPESFLGEARLLCP